jgi:hypothetical protein
MTLKTRSKIYTGNPVLRTAEETQNAINEFYKNGELPGFKDLESARKQIVKDIVEWDDGKNHIRAAQYIYETMNKDNKKSACIDLFVLVRILRALSLRLIYRSGLRVYKRLGNVAKYFDYLNSIFNNTERENEHKKYFNSLVEFYKTNNISL